MERGKKTRHAVSSSAPCGRSPPRAGGGGAGLAQRGPGRVGPGRARSGAPAPAGAVPRPRWAGGRGGAAAHVAVPRWRPLRTGLRGRQRGRGRRASAERDGSGGWRRSPRLPVGCGVAFRAAARLHHAAGLEPPRRRRSAAG